jgi:hypothetical protein
VIYVAIAQTVLIAFLLYDKRSEREHHARIQADSALQARQEREALVRRDITPDLTALIELVDRLCQRVQAPERAINEHTQGVVVPESPPAVDMFDDEEYWEPKENLAEREFEAELNG